MDILIFYCFMMILGLYFSLKNVRLQFELLTVRNSNSQFKIVS